MIVGVPLAIVAVEEVESLPVGIARGAKVPQAPFTDRSGRVAALLKQLGDRDLIVRDRILPGKLPAMTAPPHPAEGHPLELELGYDFKNRDLMRIALRHSSFVNEQPDSALEDNERLEFLGDAVVNLVAGQILMERHPGLPEGRLSRMRASLVNESSLAEIARNLKLGDHLQLGRGEELTQGREKDSILSDAYEALVAAIYLDGGFETAFRMVKTQMAPWIDALKGPGVDFDFKTRLQERIQSRHKVTPVYTLIAESGPDHDKRFTIQMEIPDLVTTGVGRSKKAAEQDAARKAFAMLDE